MGDANLPIKQRITPAALPALRLRSASAQLVAPLNQRRPGPHFVDVGAHPFKYFGRNFHNSANPPAGRYSIITQHKKFEAGEQYLRWSDAQELDAGNRATFAALLVCKGVEPFAKLSLSPNAHLNHSAPYAAPLLFEP